MPSNPGRFELRALTANPWHLERLPGKAESLATSQHDRGGRCRSAQSARPATDCPWRRTRLQARTHFVVRKLSHPGPRALLRSSDPGTVTRLRTEGRCGSFPAFKAVREHQSPAGAVTGPAADSACPLDWSKPRPSSNPSNRPCPLSKAPMRDDRWSILSLSSDRMDCMSVRMNCMSVRSRFVVTRINPHTETATAMKPAITDRSTPEGYQCLMPAFCLQLDSWLGFAGREAAESSSVWSCRNAPRSARWGWWRNPRRRVIWPNAVPGGQSTREGHQGCRSSRYEPTDSRRVRAGLPRSQDPNSERESPRKPRVSCPYRPASRLPRRTRPRSFHRNHRQGRPGAANCTAACRARTSHSMMASSRPMGPRRDLGQRAPVQVRGCARCRFTSIRRGASLASRTFTGTVNPPACQT